MSTFLKKWSGDNQSSALVFQNDNSNAPYTGIGLCKPSATGVGGNFVEWQWDGSHVNLSTNGTYLTVEGVEPISFESVGTNATRVIIRGTRKTGKAQMICYGTLNMGEADYYFDIPYSTHPQVFLSFPPGTPNTYILMGLSESQFTLDRPVSEEGGVGFFAIGEISV